MSSALAIAAVTASLKDLLNDGLIDHDLSSTVGSFSVTAQPPDRVTTGTTENNQLNLFLYQVTPNPGWRNQGYPSHNAAGERIASPPLALDLHYLLTAYGSQDLNAEVLLGYAMQVLHETPVLTRAQLRVALGQPLPLAVPDALLPGPFGPLSAVDLADQVELIKITPVYLGSDDLSKLWTAMQARYRPSMAYSISVVLIQSKAPSVSALPVLNRGQDDTGPVARAAPPPLLAGVAAAANSLQPALRLGEDLLIVGANLRSEGVSVRLEQPRYGVAQSLDPKLIDASQLRVSLPDPAKDKSAMDAWAIGFYSVVLRVTDAGQPSWGSNSVPMALSPSITVGPLAQPAGTIDLSVVCTPRIRPGQQELVRLLFGSIEVTPSAIDTPADKTKPTTLTFKIPKVDKGKYVVRLRVDGMDSLPIKALDKSRKFEFDANQTVVVS